MAFEIAVPASAGTRNEVQCKVNGINYSSAQRFVAELQEAVKSAHKNKVASLALFPLKINTTNQAGKVNHQSIANKAAFIANYEQIFSDKVKHSLLDHNAKNIFCNWQGAMIADGLIWFQSNAKEQGFFVINNP